MPLLWVCLNVQAPNCYWSYRFWGLSSNLFLEIPRYPRSPKIVKPLTCWNLIKLVVPAAVVPSRVVFGHWDPRWSKQELWVMDGLIGMDGLECIGTDEFQNGLWWDVNQFVDSGQFYPSYIWRGEIIVGLLWKKSVKARRCAVFTKFFHAFHGTN